MAIEQKKEFKLQIHILSYLTDFYYSLYRQLEDTDYEINHKSILSFRKAELKEIDQFSKSKVDYDKLSQELRKKFCVMKEDWATPSQEFIRLLYTFHKIFKFRIPWRYSKNEERNLWIVKPASNARGNGIYLTKNLGKILPKKNQRGKNGQDNLVMKYIENPMLLPIVNPKQNRLDYHKFDLRFWVLISSINPLRIYIFDKFYCRLCSVPYDPENLSPLSNLTNYSVNKQEFKAGGGSEEIESALSCEYLKNYIKDKKNIDWDDEIQPVIEKIVISTLKACKGKIQHRERSFEIFGFDILLDENFKPWLLEVNLSPACAKRTHFLKEMLQNMTEGLFEILRRKELEEINKIKKNKKLQENLKLKKKKIEEKLDDFDSIAEKKEIQRISKLKNENKDKKELNP